MTVELVPLDLPTATLEKTWFQWGLLQLFHDRLILIIWGKANIYTVDSIIKGRFAVNYLHVDI